ncbi:E2F-associated phosphoprotein [Amphibalanus amphitrite]|uniref:E2F-associated phosphoprotein n=1 Tax=Amphibalanus amphitrite TaxID=1232801 RepID=A0A6A4VJ38_AMPAM|nr:E2F-associated phosphoprotein [Amphibalanus amphitrite]
MEPLEKLDEIFELDSDQECDLRPIDSDDSDDEFSQDLVQRLQRLDKQRPRSRQQGGAKKPVVVEDEFERAVNAELSASMVAHCRRLAPQLVSDRSLPAAPAESRAESSAETSQPSATPAAGTASANTTATPSKGEKKQEAKKPEQEYYDDVYFDSDDDSEPGDDAKSPGAPADTATAATVETEMDSESHTVDGRAAGAPAADPGSKRSERRRRRRPVLSNDQLLYDPEMDERDQQWVDRQRRRYQPAAGSSTGNLQSKPTKLPHSDAVLNCPACMTMLCLDCQRHELYSNQYRAMFVFNCDVDSTQALRYRLKEPPKRRGRRGAVEKESDDRSSPADSQELFNPVKCATCKTEVAVYDSDEVYHFFNVIASHS